MHRWFLAAAMLAAAACNRQEAAPADLLKTGMDFKTKGDYPQALAQFTLALKATPDDAALLNTRGSTYMVMGQHDSALKDFNRAIELKPDYAQAIKSRGRTHFYLGHFTEATTDLRRGSDLDPKNLYVAIWVDVALMRQGQDGLPELTAGIARADSAGWPMPIAQFLVGKLTAEQLDIAAASSAAGATRESLCTMFYVGESALAKHDTTQALSRFAEARDKCPHTATEYHASVGEFGRLSPAKK